MRVTASIVMMLSSCVLDAFAMNAVTGFWNVSLFTEVMRLRILKSCKSAIAVVMVLIGLHFGASLNFFVFIASCTLHCEGAP